MALYMYSKPATPTLQKQSWLNNSWVIKQNAAAGFFSLSRFFWKLDKKQQQINQLCCSMDVDAVWVTTQIPVFHQNSKQFDW